MTLQVLVLGGSGLIGSHLVGQLVEEGHDVSIFSRNPSKANLETVKQGLSNAVSIKAGSLLDLDALSDAIIDADVIYHKAASTGVEASAANSISFLETNVMGTANLAHVLKNQPNNVTKVILGSSISVYGEGAYTCPKCGTVRPPLRYDASRFVANCRWNPDCPNCYSALSPEFIEEAAERKGESIYAISKKAQEDLMLGVCHQKEITLTILRYCTVYGSNQAASSPYSKFARILMNGENPVLYEDGQQSRDFLHVSDAVSANISALKQEITDTFNIGSGIQISLCDFITLLGQTTEKILKERFASPTISQLFVRGDVRHCYADISKAQLLLRFKPTISLEAGLTDLVNWFANTSKVS